LIYGEINNSIVSWSIACPLRLELHRCITAQVGRSYRDHENDCANMVIMLML